MSERSLSTTSSLNNRIVLKVYVPGAIETKIKNGFAGVSQAIVVKGLEVLLDAKLSDGTTIEAGSIAFIREKSLFTLPQFKEIFESDAVGQPFVIANIEQVEFIKRKV
jgi:hypothetical protein